MKDETRKAAALAIGEAVLSVIEEAAVARTGMKERLGFYGAIIDNCAIAGMVGLMPAAKLDCMLDRTEAFVVEFAKDHGLDLPGRAINTQMI